MPKPRNEKIQIWVTGRERAQWAGHAESQNLTFSEWARRALQRTMLSEIVKEMEIERGE